MERIDISILGREYSLACAPAEKESLLDAVRYVDRRMNTIQASGRLSSNERIAVMAAIQIAGELLAMRAPDGPLNRVALGDFQRKIDDMNKLLDQALEPMGQKG